MTEDEVRCRIGEGFGREVLRGTETFLKMVVAENQRQNLIASSTIVDIWARHAWDSLQLASLAEARSGTWLDVGSGGGFPGLLVALTRVDPTILVEPRKRRAVFLREATEALALDKRVTVIADRIQKVEVQAGVISARAVAGIGELLEMTAHCANRASRWLLPRGAINLEEVNQLRATWDFVFHVEQSDVLSTSQIAVLDGVRRR